MDSLASSMDYMSSMLFAKLNCVSDLPLVYIPIHPHRSVPTVLIMCQIALDANDIRAQMLMVPIQIMTVHLKRTFFYLVLSYPLDPSSQALMPFCSFINIMSFSFTLHRQADALQS